MKNNRIYIPILLILLRFRHGITANKLKTEGPKYVSYDMWLGLCDKIVATAEEAYKKVSMDKNMVGRTKNIKAIEGAFKNFEVIVGKVKEHCRQMKQLQHLPKFLPMDDGYSLRLDIASRGHGRVVVASVLAFHRYYNEFIVVSKIEKEDIDYLGALNFLESNIIETTSCSSFSHRVNFAVLIAIVFMIPYISL